MGGCEWSRSERRRGDVLHKSECLLNTQVEVWRRSEKSRSWGRILGWRSGHLFGLTWHSRFLHILIIPGALAALPDQGWALGLPHLAAPMILAGSWCSELLCAGEAVGPRQGLSG